MENILPIDGGQCKGGLSDVDTNEVRSKPSRDIIGAKDVRSSTRVHLYNGASTLLEAHPSDQANARFQQPCHVKGDKVGSVGAAIDSVSREGKNKGEDVIDGMEFEKGSEGFVSFE